MTEIAYVHGDTPPVAPYTPAVVAAGLVFTAGHISSSSAGDLVADDFDAQARRTFANLGQILDAAGSGLDRVLQLTTYLVNADDFDAFNRVYCEVFAEPYPARATVQSTLLGPGMLIECTAVAALR